SAKGDDKFITTDYLQQCLFSSKLACPTNSSRVYLRRSNRTSTATSTSKAKMIIFTGHAP
ncbi:hypothetical protein ACR96H_26930, partial [Klebsiella pneumoniae]